MKSLSKKEMRDVTLKQWQEKDRANKEMKDGTLKQWQEKDHANIFQHSWVTLYFNVLVVFHNRRTQNQRIMAKIKESQGKHILQFAEPKNGNEFEPL
jgi:hypothetical protein